jgi:dipeptidyl aminopeptidase/acylaminoacyl peptidase
VTVLRIFFSVRREIVQMHILKNVIHVVVIVCSLCCVELQRANAQTGFGSESKNEPSRINISPARESAKHPITLNEILSTRKPSEPQISPDGKKIAFIVQQALLEHNENRTELYLVNTDGGSQPVKLIDEKGLSQIRWLPDSQFITYLSSKSGSAQVWQLNVANRTSEQVTHHATGIGQYEWSHDGKKIAFLISRPFDVGKKEQAEARGVLYDGLGGYGNLNKSWLARQQEFWIYDVLKRAERKVSDQRTIGLTITGIAWALDDRKIAVSGRRPFNYSQDVYQSNIDIGVISLDDSKYVPLVTWGGFGFSTDLRWSPDSSSISFVSNGGTQGKRISYIQNIFTISIRGGKPVSLLPVSQHMATIDNRGWSKDGSKIFFETRGAKYGVRTLFEASAKGGAIRQIARVDGYLSEFSLDGDQALAACIRQNTMAPPEVAVVHLDSGVVKTLTTLNPEYRNIRLSEVSELELTNRYGNKASSFLIKPLDYVAGRRYPLVVVLYRFSGQFLADVFGNYPIQAFAANGHAVLCVNSPEFDYSYSAGNFKEASMVEAYNPSASIVAGVEKVIKMGIANPKKVGIMGWSYGSFLTDFTITHNPNIFAAASSGEGGLYASGSYWLTREAAQKEYDNVLGGPPYGETFKNWQDMSPTLNAAHVRLPVIMEYTDTNVGGLEFYTALKKQGGQVELIIYSGESHIFVQPKHRFYSMQRNLDWFNYWLIGKVAVEPEKADQYARWNIMKQDLAVHKAKDAGKVTEAPSERSQERKR